MPKTRKGHKIMRAMKRTYGPKKAKRVFYASRNAGRISGVEKRTRRRHKKGHA